MFTWIFLSGALAGLGGYAAVSLAAARQVLRSHRRFPTSDPSAVGLAFEEVWFQSRDDALNIAAWYIPAAESTRAIIIAHGVGGCRGREFTVNSLELFEHLVSNGFALLVLDLRGHGESDPAPMTYGQRERRDLLGAVDWLLARGFAPGAIGVLGLSMGGVAGIGAASEEPAIGALVVDSSCADFVAMMRLHFKRLSKLPLAFLPGSLLMGWLLTGENLAHLKPAVLLGKMRRLPTLIIHSQGDKMVPKEHASANASACDAELWITKSAKHLGSLGAEKGVYIRRVIQFFERALPTNDSIRFAEPDYTLVGVESEHSVYTS